MRSPEMGAKKGQPQVHPDGPLISVDGDERERLRVRREDLGLRQEDVARRARCSTATISNLESGRSKQVRKKVYARIRRVLSPRHVGSVPVDNDEVFRTIVDGLVDLDDRGERAVAALVGSLRRPR